MATSTLRNVGVSPLITVPKAVGDELCLQADAHLTAR
jgi:hypothetical protein